jgi:ABC-type multidrug transport system fused ATPase/permease subunit
MTATATAAATLTSRQAWREYLRLYRGRWPAIAMSVVVSVIPSVLLALAAMLVRRVFDVALVGKDETQLVVLVCAIVALQLAAQALLLVGRSVVLHVTKGAVAELRHALMDTLLVTSRQYLDSRKTSDLHSLIVDDSERVDVMSNAGIATLLPALASTLALTALLFSISVKLTAILLLFVPIAFLVTRTIEEKTRQSVRMFHDSYRRFSGGTATVVRLLDLTRIQAAEEAERSGSVARIAELRGSSTRMAWLQTAMAVVHQSVLASGVAVALLAGGVMVIGGHITLGQLMSFLVATALLRSQLVPAGPGLAQIIGGEESLVRLYGFLHLAPPESYRGTEAIEFDGEVILDEVTFGYDLAPAVLERVSLRIESGRVAALIGENGAGKSTILRLILGFYAPRSGRITADGHSYEDLDIRALRRSMGVVMQEPLILDATVRQNIVYGFDDVEDEEIGRAILLAGAADMIARLPDGLETHVGENGSFLSGGQRQRIAIARALLRKPRLLVLDEPTRHLDPESVDHLLRTLRCADWPHATLVVSHDEEIANLADVVYLVGGHGVSAARRGGLARSSPA